MRKRNRGFYRGPISLDWTIGRYFLSGFFPRFRRQIKTVSRCTVNPTRWAALYESYLEQFQRQYADGLREMMTVGNAIVAVHPERPVQGLPIQARLPMSLSPLIAGVTLSRLTYPSPTAIKRYPMVTFKQHDDTKEFERALALSTFRYEWSSPDVPPKPPRPWPGEVAPCR